MPVELLLDVFNESDALPDEAEPALEADEAKLSAKLGIAAAAHSKVTQLSRNGALIIEAP
ncbi:MAG: hypothetical protein ACHP83_12005 [Burkholderiales bacterium]